MMLYLCTQHLKENQVQIAIIQHLKTVEVKINLYFSALRQICAQEFRSSTPVPDERKRVYFNAAKSPGVDRHADHCIRGGRNSRSDSGL